MPQKTETSAVSIQGKTFDEDGQTVFDDSQMIKVKTKGRKVGDSIETLPTISQVKHDTQKPSVNNSVEYVIEPPPIPSEFHRF